MAKKKIVKATKVSKKKIVKATKVSSKNKVIRKKAKKKVGRYPPEQLKEMYWLYQKGNPGGPGRKPGQKYYSDAVRQLMMGESIKVKWVVNGKKKELKVTSSENFFHGLAAIQIMQALKGDTRAIKELVDRVEGKVTQNIDATIEATGFAELLKRSRKQADGNS